MGNPVYVFPGQGSQRRGMGASLFHKYPDLVAKADACLGYSIIELCVEDPSNVLAQTQYTQPALYVVNVLTYLDRVEQSGVAPSYVAGHSLGEYCALFAAGAFDFETGLEIVRRRGALMSEAPRGAMAAVLKLDHRKVQELLAQSAYENIDIANWNSSRQLILSGVFEEIHAPELRRCFVEAGASFIPLNVSAGFHSRCMLGVQREFDTYLRTVKFNRLTKPVVANRTARPYSETDYINPLSEQISNPVRWYESISWLLDQGHDRFEEMGPGKVLSKLTEQIRREPYKPKEGEVAIARSTQREPRVKSVFMYGGQGSQYYQMGRELLMSNPVFEANMAQCSRVYEGRCGASLLRHIYPQNQSPDPFDEIIASHAGLFAIGWSMTQVLLEMGYQPDAVVGYSLGEYVAAAVAGVVTMEEGMTYVIGQAEALQRRRCSGAMLSVLAPQSLYEDRQELFRGVHLAGVNFSRNFVLSGRPSEITRVKQRLDAESVITAHLPVRYGFHSELIDGIREDCALLARPFRGRRTAIPMYSCALGRAVAEDAEGSWDTHFWKVVRSPVNFDQLICSEFPRENDQFFVDLSANGSCANALKHGHSGRYRSLSMINQFGNNTKSLTALKAELARLKKQ